MCPGECIIQDRGEFCNKVSKLLNDKFHCNIRCISAGRPQANGQVERYVGIVKEKMRAIMAEVSKTLPVNWDETILHAALQVVRADPSCATGFAPGHILLGRPLVYPMELEKDEVDFTGTELTKTLVDALEFIHDDVFGKAAKKISRHQAEYEKQYNKRHRSKKFDIRTGMKVQYRKHKAKSPYSKRGLKYLPRKSFYKVHAIDRKKRQVYLRDPKTNKVFKTPHPFDRIRRYRGR